MAIIDYIINVRSEIRGHAFSFPVSVARGLAPRGTPDLLWSRRLRLLLSSRFGFRARPLAASPNALRHTRMSAFFCFVSHAARPINCSNNRMATVVGTRHDTQRRDQRR